MDQANTVGTWTVEEIETHEIIPPLSQGHRFASKARLICRDGAGRVLDRQLLGERWGFTRAHAEEKASESAREWIQNAAGTVSGTK